MSGIAFRELSPVSFLERAAVVFADRPAVVDGAQSYTYSQFWDRAQRLAGMLAAHGVPPGDRVTVLSPNTHVLVEAHYGVPLAGAVLVALNTRLAAAEIGYILEHSGAQLAIVDTEYRRVLDEAAPGPDLVVIDSECYDSLRDEAEPHRVEVTDERSLLSINYTSGTKGWERRIFWFGSSTVEQLSNLGRPATGEEIAATLHAVDAGADWLPLRIACLERSLAAVLLIAARHRTVAWSSRTRKWIKGRRTASPRSSRVAAPILSRGK
ncbi:AMP-binding protein [Saccharopolyspora phatthalungensis]|uniref:AMP-dependent synthetase/ligase domain-containing protein n=1 Tax=Saccharopolyspora phatthalungensis TaxID=664693 RepID=A0A840QGQ0_9PSEU|nr:AMP-binding protein [Saccharopolyspora phatthalungensis]MBB5157715.1 hypothetical protein [Saccharopolyspora phatthalungensis]